MNVFPDIVCCGYNKDSEPRVQAFNLRFYDTLGKLPYLYGSHIPIF